MHHTTLSLWANQSYPSLSHLPLGNLTYTDNFHPSDRNYRIIICSIIFGILHLFLISSVPKYRQRKKTEEKKRKGKWLNISHLSLQNWRSGQWLNRFSLRGRRRRMGSMLILVRRGCREWFFLLLLVCFGGVGVMGRGSCGC